MKISRFPFTINSCMATWAGSSSVSQSRLDLLGWNFSTFNDEDDSEWRWHWHCIGIGIDIGCGSGSGIGFTLVFDWLLALVLVTTVHCVLEYRECNWDLNMDRSDNDSHLATGGGTIELRRFHSHWMSPVQSEHRWKGHKPWRRKVKQSDWGEEVFFVDTQAARRHCNSRQPGARNSWNNNLAAELAIRGKVGRPEKITSYQYLAQTTHGADEATKIDTHKGDTLQQTKLNTHRSHRMSVVSLANTTLSLHERKGRRLVSCIHLPKDSSFSISLLRLCLMLGQKRK